MSDIRLIHKNEKGMVLPLGLMFLAIIAILGTTAVIVTTTDLKIGSNYRASVQAFYNADAGVQYAIAKIEDGLGDGTFTLPASGETSSFTFDQPADFSFNISDISTAGSNAYTFTSTGSGPGNSQAVIEVTFQRDSALDYAVFGDKKVVIKDSANIYSYNHDTTPNPTPSNSTGEAGVGSNKKVEIEYNAYIDGDVALGDDGAGTEAIIETGDDVTITGSEGVDVDRVDSDPLGVVGGEYEQKFTDYKASNDNNDYADPAISGTEIKLEDESMTLYGKSGGANYYLTSIELEGNSTLTIDTTNGPVNIFLTVKMQIEDGAAINTGGAPSKFSIFSNSNEDIEIKGTGVFNGLIYAPYAYVKIKNDGNFYGAIWAGSVEIKDSGNVYFDTSLKDKIQSNDLSLAAWREVL